MLIKPRLVLHTYYKNGIYLDLNRFFFEKGHFKKYRLQYSKLFKEAFFGVIEPFPPPNQSFTKLFLPNPLKIKKYSVPLQSLK